MSRVFAMLALCALAARAVTAADVRPRVLLLDAALSGRDVIAVGERGTILLSPDNARTWQRAATATRATLTGVSFAPDPDAKLGWAVGHDAIILATTDGGRTWTKQFQGADLQESFLDVLALDAQHAIAIGAYGLFLRTSDGGKAWTRQKILEDDAHLNRITRGPAGTLYIAGERGTLLRSTDRGETWQPIPARYDGSFYGILPLDQKTLLAYGLEGRAFASTDDGASWLATTTPEPVLLATAVRLKSNTLVLAGNGRAPFISTDAGQTFRADENSSAAIAELLELPDGRVLALGEAGATVLPKAQ